MFLIFIQTVIDPEELEYRLEAERTWAIAWEILHDEHGWNLDKGSTLDTGRVSSKSYKGLGRVSKLQVRRYRLYNHL